MAVEITSEKKKILDLFRVGNIMTFGNPKEAPFSYGDPARGEYVVTGLHLRSTNCTADVMPMKKFSEFILSPVSLDPQYRDMRMPGMRDLKFLFLNDEFSYVTSLPKVVSNFLTSKNVLGGITNDFHHTGKLVTARQDANKQPFAQIVSTDLTIIGDHRIFCAPLTAMELVNGSQRKMRFNPALYEVKSLQP